MDFQSIDEPEIETSNNVPGQTVVENPREVARIRKISDQKNQFIEEIKKEVPS
jgi:hypothetical protein